MHMFIESNCKILLFDLIYFETFSHLCSHNSTSHCRFFYFLQETSSSLSNNGKKKSADARKKKLKLKSNFCALWNIFIACYVNYCWKRVLPSTLYRKKASEDNRKKLCGKGHTIFLISIPRTDLMNKYFYFKKFIFVTCKIFI